MFLLKYVQSHSITESLWGIWTDWVSWLRYPLPSASCLHGSHAVDVADRRGRGISWYPSHSMQSTLQWSYCSLACDANHVTWSDRRQDMSRGLEIWCRVYGHASKWGWGYTLQYCSQDKSRVSTDRGSLTRYMHGGAFDGAFKALRASW